MSRHFAVMLLLLAATGAAQAVTKCESGRETLYTTASCPAGYKDVSAGMRGNVTTVAKSAKTRQDEQAYLRNRAQMAQQIQNWNAQEDELDWRAQNAFWNQCRALEYQARATERAMHQTEYWSYADRYRNDVRALRAQQYEMGCVF
ncbi:hypothetical protein SAMN05216345_10549 [Cupriavidus sp. YR651]|uniref:hypothetical protein n=1 Tax=Cupriavidus sp. YR651 TaxID=1855315 RepID=UPI00088EACD0|nr:hypothetical protein [Cupriavidus sp. YR651]SDC97824.1 hypothetical protein SAMN05216345_10549 [Cupriavidus sp. YR651]